VVQDTDDGSEAPASSGSDEVGICMQCGTCMCRRRSSRDEWTATKCGVLQASVEDEEDSGNDEDEEDEEDNSEDGVSDDGARSWLLAQLERLQLQSSGPQVRTVSLVDFAAIKL